MIKSDLVPWPAVVQELSVARSLPELAQSLEQLTAQLCQAPQVLYYALRSGTGASQELYRPAQPEDRLPYREENLVGACLLNFEILHYPQERLELPFEARSAVAVPVKLYGRPLGSLLIADPAQPLDEADLTDLGQVASLALESVERLEDMAAFSRQAEDLMMRAVEARQGDGHLGRVARLAVEIAKLMDLSSQTRQRLWRAALYHDVGLLFPGGLAQHSQTGAEYLSNTRVLAELAPLVAAHHERYDGSGRPAGLKGDQVATEGWVLALAEHLEELRCERQGETVASIVEHFFAGPARSHLPAAVDALGGLLVSGRLEQLLAQ